MRGAVRPDYAGAIDGEQYVEVLQRHVVDQLVVGALQEAGVDRHHRLAAFAGHAGGQRHRVLFGDGHVEIACRVFLAEAHQTGAFAHCRSDAQQALVGSRHVAEPVAEHVGVGRLLHASRLDQPHLRVER